MKPSGLIKALDLCVKAKRPAFVWGEPGVGKSQIMATLATLRAGWQFMDFRLLIRDAVDMRGVPFVTPDGRTMWAVPAEFPQPGTKGIWFLDELNAAHPQVQAVAYQLVLDRAIGEYKLPDGWVVMAAGNNESDGAVTHRMPSPLRSRFVHLDLEVDLEDWCRWAVRANVDPMVVAFIRFRPDLLHQFDKKAREFPCPRTWEFVSDICKENPDPEIEHALFAGTVGEGAAVEFSGFKRLYQQLPSLDLILGTPKSASIPDAPAALYAVASGLARRATLKNFAAVVTYLERLPNVEFAVMAVKDACRRDPSLQQTSTFVKFQVAHADVTFA